MTRFYHSSISSRRFYSNKHLLSQTIFITFFALAALLVTSCEEGNTKIGSGILPESDFVATQSIDTLTVRSFTMYDDSIQTNNATNIFLGEIYDPYFGTTTAEFVTQIRMGSPWDDGSFNVDSVKLFMQFTGVKGGANATHKLHISEIAEQIYRDTAYYSNKAIALAAYDMPDITLPVLKADTVNNVRLTSDTSKLFHSNTKPDFRSYFKGLYFRMYTSADPMLVSLDLTPPTTYESYSNYIVLYMHDDAGTYKEFWFVLDAINRNAAFIKFIHNFSTALPGKKINHINDVISATP
jgi:hypothetical protein